MEINLIKENRTTHTNQDIGANHETAALGDGGEQVNECRPIRGWATEHKAVGPKVFDMLAGVHELERVLERASVNVRLRGRAPVDGGLGLLHVEGKARDSQERDERSPPLDEEHDADAEQRAEQTHPPVVVLEGWPPAGRAREWGVEARVVHQRVGHEEEIGDEGRDHVEVAHAYERRRDDEREQVAAPGLSVLASAHGEEFNVGKDLVLADRLEHLGRAHQARQRRRERRREDARRDYRPEQRHHRHDVVAVHQAVTAAPVRVRQVLLAVQVTAVLDHLYQTCSLSSYGNATYPRET